MGFFSHFIVLLYFRRKVLLNFLNAASFESSSLIAQTIQQIDKLGSELDSYCSAPPQGTVQTHVRLRSGTLLLLIFYSFYWILC